jgi:hypothetical protein
MSVMCRCGFGSCTPHRLSGMQCCCTVAFGFVVVVCVDIRMCHPLQELLAKCHPLGMFDAIATLAVASNMRELYRLVLVSTSRDRD